MVNKIVVGFLAVMVASMVFFASIPIYGSISVYTVEYDNEGGGDVRYNLLDSHGTFNITLDSINDEIVAINGTNNQVMDNGQFFYADNNFSVYLSETGNILLTGKQADNTIATYHLLDTPVNVQRTGTGVIVTSGDISYNYGAPLYSYVPLSTGKYATYYDGTEIITSTSLKDAFIGNYAGVTAYNSMNDCNINTSLDKTISEDGKLSGGLWIVNSGAPEEDQGLLNPGDNMIMAVPTPTYTENDWGYDLITTGYDTTVAKIVSYSGTGGGSITIPATIGGYDVKEVGKGGADETVFNTSLVATNLTISNGIVKINSQAFRGCSGFTGSLVIPDSVTYIGDYAFSNCSGFTGSLVIPDSVTIIGNNAFVACNGFTGSLVIPDSVTRINSSAFSNCRGLTGPLVIPDSVTSIGDYAFSNCRGLTGLVIYMEQGGTISAHSFNYTTDLKEVLNLGSFELTTTSYGLNAEEIRNNIPVICFIGDAVYAETVINEGIEYQLIELLPLLSVLGLLLGTIVVFLIRRV